MSLIKNLSERWKNINYPFLIYKDEKLYFDDLIKQNLSDLSVIKEGDVVALIGDFDPKTIFILLKLIEKNIILVPLTEKTKNQHQFFFKTAFVDVVINSYSVKRIKHYRKNKLIEHVRKKKRGGLILFSTGTTGNPKAILHDLTLFMKRFETPRPKFKTINFLLFDHIGGINTLMHTLYNMGTVVAPEFRDVKSILKLCIDESVEVLPATPTFLRMMLLSGLVPKHFPKSIKIITYGTERMDQITLDALCKLLPDVDFRQTYGMSELGIIRVKSESRNSLFMKLGGEGIETRVIDNELQIRSKNRMVGYLNDESPFDDEGWYKTKDIVEKKNGLYKIVGRNSEAINVGGLKFMASEVERIVLKHKKVKFAKVEGRSNPISGQHVELIIQPLDNIKLSKLEIKDFLSRNLSSYMMPKRIRFENISIGHRFKIGK